MASDTFSSTDDARTGTAGVRHSYRKLTDEERARIDRIKDLGAAFIDEISADGTSRETSIARTKIEEAVMWAVKGITA